MKWVTRGHGKVDRENMGLEFAFYDELYSYSRSRPEGTGGLEHSA